jgi:hypothetical protein
MDEDEDESHLWHVISSLSSLKTFAKAHLTFIRSPPQKNFHQNVMKVKARLMNVRIVVALQQIVTYVPRLTTH